MTKLFRFLFILLCLCTTQPSIAQISFSIDEPFYRDGTGSPDNIITDSTFYAVVHINSSTFEIATVKAVAEDSIFSLLYDNAWGSFRGKINISGYVQGVKRQLKIIVRDMAGNEKIDSVGYTYAKAPTSKIILPLALTNGYPSLPLKVSVTGVDTLKVIIKVFFNSAVTTTVFLDTFFVPAGVIDTAVNVSSSVIGAGKVEVNVWDKFGQSSDYAYVDILADNSLFATPYYEGTGKIIDFNYNRILEARDHYFYHIDTSREATQLPNSYYQYSPGTGKISLFGALYGGTDWTPGATYPDGYTTGVAGKYKTRAWNYMVGGSDFASINLTDMETRTTTSIDTVTIRSGGGQSASVAENGLLAYNLDAASPLYKYKDGVKTAIGANIPGDKTGPLTDGNYILYVNHDNENYSVMICLHNGVSDSVVSDFGAIDMMGNFSLLPVSNYIVVNKYMAYSKWGTSGQFQVWLNDSTGNARQVTFFGTTSTIAGLNAKGDLMFTNNSNLYYLKNGTLTPRDLGTFRTGSVVQRDSSWYKIEGRYIYKLNPDASRSVANGNWTNPASWEGETVPLPGADVIVTTNIIVNANVTCNTIKVVPPGSITVLPGVNVTVLH